MAAKVTFVNRDDKSQIFKMNLFGPDKKRVKVANILACLNSKMAIMEDGCILEADDDGLSMDTFDAGATYMLSLVPYSIVALHTLKNLQNYSILPKTRELQRDTLQSMKGTLRPNKET